MSKTGTMGLLRAAMFAAGTLGMLFAPKPGQADNLADAMIGAYKTSGLLEQNRALLRAADEDVATTLAQLRPVLDWLIQAGYTYLPDNGFRQSTETTQVFTGLRLQQLLYDGGALNLTRKQAQETVLSSRQTLLAIEQSVLLRAVEAYNNVLLAEENLDVRANNLRLLEEERRAAEDRFEVGEVTRTDVALAESRVADAQANLTSSRGLLINARADYVNIVGHDPGTLSGPHPLPKLAGSVKEAQNLAVRNHPLIVSEQHAVKAADYRIQAAQKALGPSASLQVDVGIRSDSDLPFNRDSISTTLQFSQPIYAGGAIASSIRRTIALRDAARGNLITVQRDVVQNVKSSYVAFEVATANLASAGERIRAAQIAFDGIREEATLGARTTLDVLQAEQELLDAQTSQIDARTNQAIAAYDVLASQGLLTAERMGLAVQIYDPTVYYNLVKDAPPRNSQQSKDLDRVLEALGRK